MTNATACDKRLAADAVLMMRDAQDDGPDLSISLRPGKETNVDFRSRGDRKGKSPSGKPSGVVAQYVINAMESAAIAGDSPGVSAGSE